MGIFDKFKKMVIGESKTVHPPPPPQSIEQKQAIYIAGIEMERQHKDSSFQSSPYASPLSFDDRQDFTGLKYFSPDPNFCYVLDLKRVEPEPITFKTSTDDERVYERVGSVSFEVNGQMAKLALYQSEGEEDFFLPFKDKSSGKETYGGGRYLEPSLQENNKVLLDFNLAYNPYCAYSSNFSCPLPPLENWLKVAIEAGEKNYKAVP